MSTNAQIIEAQQWAELSCTQPHLITPEDLAELLQDKKRLDFLQTTNRWLVPAPGDKVRELIDLLMQMEAEDER